MSIEVRAIGHRLVIQPYSIEQHDKVYASAGAVGIVIPEQDKRLLQTAIDRGTVIEIGPNAWKAFDDGTPWCKVGDLIGFTKNAGKYIKVNDKDHVLVINDEDVVAVLEEKEND